MPFDLNSPTLAQYHWGTLFCRFSAAAPINKETFRRTIVSISERTASWTTDDEFRVFVAFLHELVHLAQDITTGLGHADYLTHVTETPNLLHYASLVVQLDGAAARPPYRQRDTAPWFEDNEDPIVVRAQQQLRYCPFAMIPRERLERTRGILEQDLKRPIDDEALFDFSTQSILECDAALAVFRTVKRLGSTDSQHEILKRNQALLDPGMVGPEYWKASGHLEGVLRRHADLDDAQVAGVIPDIFGFFVDSALACPPLDWIQAHGNSPEAFEPGVKYVRLLLAFQTLAGEAMDRFWYAFSEHELAEAEAILLGRASFHYPSAEEVFEAWIEALEPWVARSIVAEVRSAACRYRLDHGSLQRGRDIDLLCAMEAPILYLHKDHGFVKHDWGERVFDSEKNFTMMLELVDSFMIMELVEFLFRTGEFRCPHAQANICSAAEDRCASGLVHLAQFPESAGCVARSLLAQYGVIQLAG